eukprot:9107359-Pyramimonas_sp.AAC.1
MSGPWQLLELKKRGAPLDSPNACKKHAVASAPVSFLDLLDRYHVAVTATSATADAILDELLNRFAHTAGPYCITGAA